MGKNKGHWVFVLVLFYYNCCNSFISNVFRFYWYNLMFIAIYLCLCRNRIEYRVAEHSRTYPRIQSLINQSRNDPLHTIAYHCKEHSSQIGFTQLKMFHLRHSGCVLLFVEF